MVDMTLSVLDLAKLIKSRAVSVSEVVETTLKQIALVQPSLNAVVQLAPDARARAKQADDDLAHGITPGPLHGIPFTVKDTFATAGLSSPLDARLRGGRTPAIDATVVARLRHAGAILVAKSNCPPAGHGTDTENAITGRTFNPYHLGHTPGGSSGGEAALVAAGVSSFGLGSDQSGGLRVPAHYCGVTTLKPTAGRVPNTGVYNQPGGLTDQRSQIGPVARRVADLALLMPLIIGADYEDAGVIPMAWPDPRAVDLKRLTVAFFTDDPASPVSAETGRAVGAAAQALARAGAIVEPARPADLIEAARQLNYHWQDLAGMPGRTVVEFYSLWDDFRTHLLRFMARYDLLLCPVAGQPAPSVGERDPRRFDYTVPFSLSGYPAAVVRVAASATGLPIGVQLVARPWREDTALALAAVLEAEFGGWQRPRL